MERLNPFTYSCFDDLVRDYNIQISSVRLSKWRLLYPNAGTLDGFPHLGTVLILATDGTEAFFNVGNGEILWHGHLKAFNGPIAKTYVWDIDWDYDRRKRKVNVFRRHDGSYAIIPRDKEMDEYKELHPSWCKFGNHPEDEGFSARSKNVQRVKVKTKRQQLLAAL